MTIYVDGRDNPKDCLCCGMSKEIGEIVSVKQIEWSSGHIDNETCVICTRCGNMKYGSIKRLKGKIL